MSRAAHKLSLALPFLLAGCHSHYIQVQIHNSSDTPLNVIQVEYPSASFGTQQLLPGATFRYRFKLLGSGPIKLTFIDTHNGEHSQSGPWLNEGQEGQLDIAFTTATHAEFKTKLKP